MTDFESVEFAKNSSTTTTTSNRHGRPYRTHPDWLRFESGNAGRAMRLGEQSSLQPYRPVVKELNAISPPMWASMTPLLIVSSSFGDGEPPPANAERFSDALAQWLTATGCATPSSASATPRTRIFCGFTQALDARLTQYGATPSSIASTQTLTSNRSSQPG
ncbi:hypothetical protein M8494_19050 [Serratia ureilytica]